MFKDGLLEGKNILITGGGTGLGKEIAARYLELGAELWIAGRRGAVLEATARELTAKHGGKVRTHAVDIRDYAAVDAMAQHIWDESGQPEVYVAAFPGFTDRRQISTGGATMPLWRRDGRELFYLTRDRRLVAIDVTSGVTLETGSPKVLFQANMGFNTSSYYYAVTSDGQRFLVREPASAVAVEPLHVILNWPAALEQ